MYLGGVAFLALIFIILQILWLVDIELVFRVFIN